MLPLLHFSLAAAEVHGLLLPIWNQQTLTATSDYIPSHSKYTSKERTGKIIHSQLMIWKLFTMIITTDFQLEDWLKLTDPFRISREIMYYKTNSVKKDNKNRSDETSSK